MAVDNIMLFSLGMDSVFCYSKLFICQAYVLSLVGNSESYLMHILQVGNLQSHLADNKRIGGNGTDFNCKHAHETAHIDS